MIYKEARSTSPDLELSFDDIVANSVRNKEESYGRKLNEAEAAELKAKITKLLGK